MLFFDAYAIIELINGNENYHKYKDLIILTNSLHLSEVVYSLLLRIDLDSAIKIISDLNLDLIEISSEISIESAIFRFKNKQKKLSYADCIGYITAKKNDMIFLTGDKEFENLENVEFVKK